MFFEGAETELAGERLGAGQIVIGQAAFGAVFQAPHPDNLQPHGSGGGALRPVSRIVRHPDFFEIVEFAHFRAEEMDDHVSGIDQYPVSIGHAFDAGRAAGQPFGFLRDVFGKRRHVPSGTARCDDHEVGERGFALKLNEGKVFGLVVFEDFRESLGQHLDVGKRDVFWGLNPGFGG